MLEDRFREVFSQVEIELAQSFPVINDDCELMFFYSTSANDEFSYKLNPVEYIFSRNIFSGEIRKIELCEIDEQLLNKLNGEVIRPLIMDEEAMEAEDFYYDKYEELYEMFVNKKPIDKSLAEELLMCFDKMIPDSNLKVFYKTIGKQMFALK